LSSILQNIIKLLNLSRTFSGSSISLFSAHRSEVLLLVAVVSLFVVMILLFCCNVWYHFVTYLLLTVVKLIVDGQWLWDNAGKFTKWQHPAMHPRWGVSDLSLTPPIVCSCSLVLIVTRKYSLKST